MARPGGQNKRVGSEVITFETYPEYTYVAGDATAQYNQEKCSEIVRQFLFIPPYHFVVFDRVTSTQADYNKRWLLHHANEPTIDGKTWYSDQGEGRIFCHTLLPEDAVLSPIGGPIRISEKSETIIDRPLNTQVTPQSGLATMD